MTPERYQELRRSFEELLELRPEERARTLQEISNRDAEFGAELRRLLAEHGRTAALLDRPPVEAFAHRKQEARQLGPYFLQREIGSGGMGVVYEAMRVDGSYRKRVASRSCAATSVPRYFSPALSGSARFSRVWNIPISRPSSTPARHPMAIPISSWNTSTASPSRSMPRRTG